MGFCEKTLSQFFQIFSLERKSERIEIMFFHKILSLQTPSKQPPLLIRPRLVDTIHNNKNSLATEIIYEVEPGSSQETSIIIGK